MLIQKLAIKAGTTSKLFHVHIEDSSQTDNRGLTGLTSGSSGLIAYYLREGDATTTVISLTSATLGTWTSSGFVEVDATHMNGLYEIGLPNAMIAAGAKSVKLFLKGATNMKQTVYEIELTAVDNQDAVSFGVSSMKINTIKKNTARSNFHFTMFTTSGLLAPNISPVTVVRAIDNGSFAAGTLSAVTEIGNGLYRVDLGAGDTNGDSISLLFSGTGAKSYIMTLFPVP